MDLNRLRLFRAVVERGSYSRAAVALDLSQPSVSVQVHQLERSLGSYLFYQVGRKLYLTEAGKLLKEYANQIFTLETNAERAVRQLAGLEQGQLAIGATYTIATYMLPPALGEFRHRYPGVEFTLTMGTTQEMQERILENDLDIAFVAQKVEHPLLRTEPYSMDKLVVIAPGNHPFSAKSRVPVRELAQESFVLREKGSSTRAIVEEKLQALGVKYQVGLEVEGPEAVKQAVAAGLGVSVVSQHAVSWETKIGRLAVVPVPELDFVRPLYQVQLHSRPISHAAETLLGLVGAQNSGSQD